MGLFSPAQQILLKLNAGYLIIECKGSILHSLGFVFILQRKLILHNPSEENTKLVPEATTRKLKPDHQKSFFFQQHITLY